jgi:hypothetical protein
MENEHVDAVPYGWWERAGRNPWYDRGTRMVTLPRTIRYANNYVLPSATIDSLLEISLREQGEIAQRVRRLRAQHNAREKGMVNSFSGEEELLKSGPVTIASLLEWMVTDGKLKLEKMNVINTALEAIIAAKKG